MLHEFNEYEKDKIIAELPVRTPGDPFWKEISDLMNRNKKREEMKTD